MAAPPNIAGIFSIFLKLGCISFGGAVAHFGYLHGEFVNKRRWLDEAEFSDLLALCNFLPGPASSQLVFSLGMKRAGLAGALAASIGFLLPSAIIMILFGYGVTAMGNPADAGSSSTTLGSASGWLHGLMLAAAAVVAQAVWIMGRKLCPDGPRILLMLAAAFLAWSVPGAWGQVGAMLGGAVIGLGLRFTVYGSRFEKNQSANIPGISSPMENPATQNREPQTVNREPKTSHLWATVALVVFAVLLMILPALAAGGESRAMKVCAGIYRAGALVFGGGHVVLPLLQGAVVPPGWMNNDQFLAGYGAAQALPGPLFSFAGYLGTVIFAGPKAWLGGLMCLFAIYLPAWLLIGGSLPFWHTLRAKSWAKAALRGTGAAVVGILLAALYNPVCTQAIGDWRDAATVVLAFALLEIFRVPPWAVVILAAAAGRFIL